MYPRRESLSDHCGKGVGGSRCVIGRWLVADGWWWMMDCTRIREQLGCYVDRELPAEECCAVEAHLAECSVCANEVADLRRLAEGFRAEADAPAPESLWRSIEARLDLTGDKVRAPGEARGGKRFQLAPFRRPLAAAASLLLVIGLSLVGIVWLQSTTPRAKADTIDFGILLDGLSDNVHSALSTFLDRYGAQEITADQAHALAPKLDFEIPPTLPGGFRRTKVHVLQFGDAPGVAVEYTSDESGFLVALFHKPVLLEDYGTHEDYPCVVGKHRGHSVAVGDWRLVHLTDPSTCHCVLSRLDPERELPAVMSAIAPRSKPMPGAGSDHSHG